MDIIKSLTADQIRTDLPELCIGDTVKVHVKVNEGKAVYIYQNSVQAFIVPFSAFKSDEERKEFIAFISEKAK